MRLLSEQKKVVQRWRELERKVTDIAELISLAEDDASLRVEIQSEIDKVSSALMSWTWKWLLVVSMMPEMLF